MKRYSITLLLLLLLVIVSGCGNDEKLTDVQNEITENSNAENLNDVKEKINSNNYERLDLLMSKSRNDTKLYGIKFENDVYTEMHLEVNDECADFVWTNVPTEGYMPQMEYVDVTNDEIDELVIFNTLSVKKDYLKEEAHIINLAKMEEISFESAYDTLLRRVKFEMADDSIRVILDDKSIGKVSNTYISSICNEEDWYDEAILSDGEHYEVNGGILQGFVLAQISDYGSFGTFEVDYKYDMSSSKFIIDSIRYAGIYENE